MKATIGVRDLASIVHRHGDIHYRYDSSTSALEGIAAQKRAQRGRADTYQREVPVDATVVCHGIELTIKGRIDGFDAPAALVEEFKTTRTDVTSLHAHAGQVHMAQLKLYAAIAVRMADRSTSPSAHGHDVWRLRLTYVHPDDLREERVEQSASRAALDDFFTATIEAYTAWLAETERRIERRNDGLRELPFPFEDFRDSQQRLARGVFRVFRDDEQLLVEAPTGTGKTVSTVFPALKALGHDHLDRVVYLTARTTGQRAAEKTLQICGIEARATTAVTVTAKSRICFNPETPCDPECCQYAKGYYDRMRPARDELLAARLITRERVEEVARRHTVCPFELSLDTAAWADVVVCDYNYAFDPVVKLKRLTGPRFSRVGLLVDEAHQLGDRVRDMLTVAIERKALKRALAAAPGSMSRGLRSVDRALLTLRRQQTDGPIARPDPLVRAVDRCIAAATEIDLSAWPQARDFLFDCYRFSLGASWYTDEDFEYLLKTDGRSIEVRMMCMSPSKHIDAVLGTFRGAVRFSGTVSPLTLFQMIHGQDQTGRCARVVSELCANQLGVYVVPDVSTYYRDRARTRDDLVGVIRAVTSAARGNHLVAFPSFEYLDLVTAELDDCRVRAQQRDMSDQERAEFIAWLSAGTSRIGAVVMGGVFAESVDFDRHALAGVIVVGAGLPPRSMERDLIAARFANNGFPVAYQQPAMTRVVQAAGRVVRGSDDRGVVVLVDPRFTDASYRAFFPRHWRPVHVSKTHIGASVEAFWARHGPKFQPV